MAATGHFRIAAIALLLLGCRADARIALLGPAASEEPTPDAGDRPSQPSGAGRAGAGAGSVAGRTATAGSSGAIASGGAGRAGRSPIRPADPPDAGPPPMADEPIEGLVLRYDFSGEGTVVRDLVGDADATLMGGAELSRDRDFVELDGVDDYVDMPNDVLSGLESATFITWLAWNGGGCWQRVFDFGSSDAGEGQSGRVNTSLFMTPETCGRVAFCAMAEFEGGRIQHQLFAGEGLPPGYTLQVALAIDAERQSFTLYRDGHAVAEGPATFALSDIQTDNAWLGRSQWAQDLFFDGIVGDFRIYDRALTPDEMSTLYDRRANGL